MQDGGEKKRKSKKGRLHYIGIHIFLEIEFQEFKFF
jgi:hypothetical protein